MYEIKPRMKIPISKYNQIKTTYVDKKGFKWVTYFTKSGTKWDCFTMRWQNFRGGSGKGKVIVDKKFNTIDVKESIDEIVWQYQAGIVKKLQIFVKK